MLIYPNVVESDAGIVVDVYVVPGRQQYRKKHKARNNKSDQPSVTDICAALNVEFSDLKFQIKNRKIIKEN